MPGDTKIKRAPNGYGWIDIDNPSNVYRARRLARDARRRGHTGNGAVPARPSITPTTPAVTLSVSAVPPVVTTYTGLQQRLYDRLTTRQGVSAADAHDVITSNGYNAAASYGHMREAGANHAEAEFVIGLGTAAVSLSYGLARFSGLGHTDALKEALDDASDGGGND